MRGMTPSRKPGSLREEHLRKSEKTAATYAGLREWQTELSISRLLRTSIRLQNAFDRCFSQFGVTAQEAAVLLHCAAEGETSPGKLAQAIGRDKARITRLVDRLEAGGFLSRQSHPRERRLSLVRPTPRGRRLAPHLRSRFEEVRGQFFAGVHNTDIDRLESVLAQLQANADRLCPPKFRK